MIRSVLIAGPNSAWSLESSYTRAFRHLGIAVHLWDPEAALHRVARGDRLGALFSTFVHVEPWVRKANLELLRLADRLQPDLLLVVATSCVRAGTLAQLRVRVPRCLLYCLYPDSPHNLDSERIHCLPFFDRVTTSSPVWVDAFRRLGARQVDYLPFAADIDLHRPVTSECHPLSVHDVGFIGSWRPEREELLTQLADLDLSIWGGAYWKRRTARGSPLRTRWAGRSVAGEAFARVCASTRIMLNVMDPVTWPGPNMRTFEQPACCAFSLVTRSDTTLDLFAEGQTIECFDCAGEAREKIRYYLTHEDARRRIARAGYRFVVEGGHTYRDRARTLLGWAAQDRAA